MALMSSGDEQCFIESCIMSLPDIAMLGLYDLGKNLIVILNVFFSWFALLVLHVISNSNAEIVHGAAYIKNQTTVED